ncbi:hypothetical protein ANCDUO_14406 [Ancylostoma duodenale]|uniref:Uncharacterized protein n=1 Tax=Ancylostoma duodenale TaxID=51022 RepID=A0A0C2D080_9BILA|nr:hypothetical protein ANCDUO_14406 [Ancylostoma duodenale]
MQGHSSQLFSLISHCSSDLPLLAQLPPRRQRRTGSESASDLQRFAVNYELILRYEIRMAALASFTRNNRSYGQQPIDSVVNPQRERNGLDAKASQSVFIDYF